MMRHCVVRTGFQRLFEQAWHHQFQNTVIQSNLCTQDKYKYNIVTPGKVNKTRTLPSSIPKPPYVSNPLLKLLAERRTIEIKNDQQIQGMRNVCALARTVLNATSEHIKAGVTTDELDAIVHDLCIRNSAYPSPLLYKGYPKSVCTSVNNVACHGIPDDRALQNGDIINVDVTLYYNGFHGDLSETFLVGEVDDAAHHLVDVTRECRDLAISECGPGVPFNIIGTMIQLHAEHEDLQVIPNFCGHGIGSFFHGPPDVLHFANDEPGEMKEGMTFTIEPILTEGDPHIVVLRDGWTAVTRDDSRSAQFEHTILITPNGAEVLTS